MFMGGATVLRAPLAASPNAADRVKLEFSGGYLDVRFDIREFDVPSAAIVDWVTMCANAVIKYLAVFPVARGIIEIRGSETSGISNGTSWGDAEARCRIVMGRHTTVNQLRRDWVLTHELFHFAFPSLPEENNWLEEGISTYAEPIARAEARIIVPELVWADMVRDMPKGLSQSGDKGLDATHTWASTYWGGALFCLLADVGIRKATGNRKGLRHALRGINAAGGKITVEWPLARALRIGDEATGARVLSDLYSSMGKAPARVDLPALWAQLGVVPRSDGIGFDDNARDAAIRRVIIA